MRKLPVNIIIEVSGKEKRQIFSKRPYCYAEVHVEVIFLVLALIWFARRGVKLRTLERRGLNGGERKRRGRVGDRIESVISRRG